MVDTEKYIDKYKKEKWYKKLFYFLPILVIITLAALKLFLLKKPKTIDLSKQIEEKNKNDTNNAFEIEASEKKRRKGILKEIKTHVDNIKEIENENDENDVFINSANSDSDLSEFEQRLRKRRDDYQHKYRR